jgi:hypothetical protein
MMMMTMTLANDIHGEKKMGVLEILVHYAVPVKELIYVLG